ncbi:uncharacterized protein B0T15DRAFT_531201 [Chaetomium strumarium]|uniref:C2H2-type domain-containing protein n=1 Tax=Chaetomium strumarium TaxID=1170767 RepID=A0AAJ0M120_9PEZI|nr:hypothetical protein B0T15DRAFT_531201 [Chaetomium strumarium]
MYNPIENVYANTTVAWIKRKRLRVEVRSALRLLRNKTTMASLHHFSVHDRSGTSPCSIPASGVISQPSQDSQSALVPQTSMMPDCDPPTHVVSSQGWRGILPSPHGRSAVPAAGSAEAKEQSPQKDAERQFSCNTCSRTYRHAKHMKRHLRRHTGERPYKCEICHKTFSRSDVLKRHCIKCSSRRYNPTNAVYLSHPQAAAEHKPMDTEGDVKTKWFHMGNMPIDPQLFDRSPGYC